MKKQKEMKKLQNDIAETEFAKELFFLKATNADTEEKATADAVVYALCLYLTYLYDKKETMLETQLHSEKCAEALRRHKRRAVFAGHSVKKLP